MDKPILKFVNEAGLIDGLAAVRGAKVITIVAKTDARLVAKHRDTGVPHELGEVFKLSKVNGIIGWQYEKSVNRQLAREDKPADFKAKQRSWGHRIQGTPFVEHNGAKYVELKVQQALSTVYFTAAGDLLDESVIKPFLPKRRSSRQGVDREVVLRDYAIASIMMVKIDGQTYVVNRGAGKPSFRPGPLRALRAAA